MPEFNLGASKTFAFVLHGTSSIVVRIELSRKHQSNRLSCCNCSVMNRPYHSVAFICLCNVALLEVPMAMALMFGLIAGLLAAGIKDTLSPKSPEQ